MTKIKEGFTKEHYFAAIKLIEQLYKDGNIPDYVFRNILNEYSDIVDTSRFSVQLSDEKEMVL